MKYLSLNKTYVENAVAQILLHKPEVSFAYLFGSIVSREYYHDIDIAVYLDKNFNYKDNTSFPYGYESSFIVNLIPAIKTDKIDIVILNRADLHLFKNIIMTGKLLFERDRFFRINCENNIIKEYIDTSHIRRIKNYYLNKKISKKCTT